MSDYTLTAADLAKALGVKPRTVRQRTKALGLGINLEGRAGFRYSEADKQALIDSLKPPAPVKQRRRRRVA